MDWDKILVIVVAVVAALVGGGTMGTAVISIAKSAMTALVKQLVTQNGELTESIKQNTTATMNLTNTIHTNMAVQEVREQNKEKLLESTKHAALEARDRARELSEKLKGRI